MEDKRSWAEYRPHNQVGQVLSRGRLAPSHVSESDRCHHLSNSYLNQTLRGGYPREPL